MLIWVAQRLHIDCAVGNHMLTNYNDVGHGSEVMLSLRSRPT